MLLGSSFLKVEVCAVWGLLRLPFYHFNRASRMSLGKLASCFKTGVAQILHAADDYSHDLTTVRAQNRKASETVLLFFRSRGIHKDRSLS